MTTLARMLGLAAIAVAGASMLDGCGFRPRGALDLPENVHNVYISGPKVIAGEIEIFLDGEQVTITPTSKDADLTIAVTSDRYDRRVTAVDPSTGKEREFEVVYTVDYRITAKDGALIVAPKTLKFRRDYVFDPKTVIGDSHEESTLRDEMRVDAAYAIVRGLEAALEK